MLPLRREQRSSRVASLNHLVRLPYVAPQSLCPLSRIASNTGARVAGRGIDDLEDLGHCSLPSFTFVPLG